MLASAISRYTVLAIDPYFTYSYHFECCSCCLCYFYRLRCPLLPLSPLPPVSLLPTASTAPSIASAVSAASAAAFTTFASMGAFPNSICGAISDTINSAPNAISSTVFFGPTRKQFTDFEIRKSIALHELGWGYQRIGHHLSQLKSTINWFLKRFKELVAVENEQTPGRPKIISEDVAQDILALPLGTCQDFSFDFF